MTLAIPPDLEQAAPPERTRLSRLRIRDFRNIQRLDRTLPSDGVVVVGENGQGKTSFLEAIYYLQLLRSVRGARDIDLVRFGTDGFHLSAHLDGAGPHDVSAGFERATKRKRVLVDGAETTRLSDALGSVPAVMLSPRDADLVTGPPTERRRYLDLVLALSSRGYLHALQRYRAVLARRNGALRDVARHGRDEARAAVWEPLLAEHGAHVWSARRAWVARMTDEFASLSRAIGETAAPTLRYATALPETDDPRGALLGMLEADRARDIRRGTTHSGPHRDDLVLGLDGHALDTFGSGGQHRTAAIALRMLEAATLRAATGREPLLLLDDPFAELDARRAGRILDLLGRGVAGQVFLTVPRATDIPGALTGLDRWTVERGDFGSSGA